MSQHYQEPCPNCKNINHFYDFYNPANEPNGTIEGATCCFCNTQWVLGHDSHTISDVTAWQTGSQD